MLYQHLLNVHQVVSDKKVSAENRFLAKQIVPNSRPDWTF